MARPARRRAREPAGVARAPARAQRTQTARCGCRGRSGCTGPTRGHWTEGRRYLASALALGGDVDPERLVDAFWGAAILALWQGDVDEGEQLGRALARALADGGAAARRGIGGVHMLAIAASERGDRDQARALYEESWCSPAAWTTVAALGRDEQPRQPAPAGGRLRACDRAVRGEPGDRRGARRPRPACTGAHHLGCATHGLGDLARAHELYRRGLAAAGEIGLVEMQLRRAVGYRPLEAEAGDAVTAARLLGHMKERMSWLGPQTTIDDTLEGQTLATLKLR